ncbi:AAA family ATPase [Myroides sp. N17-2]|uniref:AAA family ATPase n=1 Tax=Myroides sp. N17-2 TaxID=2030799 RepID=UPI000EFD9789|nr:AAA family ATPase [Myroides sp. N17-2]
MKESIQIKNLGPLRDIDIKDIKPLTILIGESGSGKSTLMKCLSLFRYIFKMESIRSYLKHSKMSKSPFRFHITKQLKASGLEEYVDADTEIIYTVTFKDGEEFTIVFKDKKLQKTSTISASNLYFTKVSFVTEDRNIIPLWADNSASVAGAYLGFYFHEVYKDFDFANEALRQIDLNHVGLRFIVKKGSKGKEYVVESNTDNKYQVSFKNSSSGTQSSAPISLIAKYFSTKFNFEDAFNRSVLSYLSSIDSLTDFRPIKNLSDLNKKIYIHIEEPELSLYPDAQYKLMNELIQDCFNRNTNNINLFISTHSPYIINQLNLMIKAYDVKSADNDIAKYNYDELAVYQVGAGTLQSLIVENERLVNTNPLSDTIDFIYDQYESLK